jgi:hypothetical protein
VELAVQVLQPVAHVRVVFAEEVVLVVEAEVPAERGRAQVDADLAAVGTRIELGARIVFGRVLDREQRGSEADSGCRPGCAWSSSDRGAASG